MSELTKNYNKMQPIGTQQNSNLCMPSLPELPVQNKIITDENGTVYLSLFSGLQANTNEIIDAVSDLAKAFPAIDSGFWGLLSSRIEANKFTSERLKNAVEHVLDTFRYKNLTIADIIRFDRRVKLYSGREFMDMQAKGYDPEDFEKREINGKIFRVLKSDLTN